MPFATSSFLYCLIVPFRTPVIPTADEALHSPGSTLTKGGEFVACSTGQKAQEAQEAGGVMTFYALGWLICEKGDTPETDGDAETRHGHGCFAGGMGELIQVSVAALAETRRDPPYFKSINKHSPSHSE